MPRCLPTAIVLILVLAPTAATAADLIPGPINARVVSVYDGDTVTVDAQTWPGVTARTTVRVAGVDAPEMNGPRGPVARGALDELISERTVAREPVDTDNFGQPVARCRAGGRDLAETMILQGRAFANRTVSDEYVAAEVEAQREGRGFWERQTRLLGIPEPGWNFLAILTGALISGLIGGGVALYSLNKQRRYDALATATALRASVSKIQRALHGYTNEIEEHGSIRAPSSYLQYLQILTSQIQFYSALLPKLGILGPIVVRETVDLYTGIEAFTSDMERVGRAAPLQTHKGLARRGHGWEREAENLLRLLERHFPELSPRLRRKLKLPFRRR